MVNGWQTSPVISGRLALVIYHTKHTARIFQVPNAGSLKPTAMLDVFCFERLDCLHPPTPHLGGKAVKTRGCHNLACAYIMDDKLVGCISHSSQHVCISTINSLTNSVTRPTQRTISLYYILTATERYTFFLKTPDHFHLRLLDCRHEGHHYRDHHRRRSIVCFGYGSILQQHLNPTLPVPNALRPLLRRPLNVAKPPHEMRTWNALTNKLHRTHRLTTSNRRLQRPMLRNKPHVRPSRLRQRHHRLPSRRKPLPPPSRSRRPLPPRDTKYHSLRRRSDHVSRPSQPHSTCKTNRTPVSTTRGSEFPAQSLPPRVRHDRHHRHKDPIPYNLLQLRKRNHALRHSARNLKFLRRLADGKYPRRALRVTIPVPSTAIPNDICWTCAEYNPLRSLRRCHDCDRKRDLHRLLRLHPGTHRNHRRTQLDSSHGLRDRHSHGYLFHLGEWRDRSCELEHHDDNGSDGVSFLNEQRL